MIKKILNSNRKDPTIPGGFKHIGGGSLIHRSVVVTGAHVVAATNSVGRLMVRAGEWDTQTTKEPYPYQDRDVSNIVVNKDYKSRKYLAVICVKLKKLFM